VRPLLLLVGLLAVRPAWGASAADISAEIQQVALDPAECYRVLDLSFSKEDLKLYLTSGYLIFTKPTQGVRLGAVFVVSQQAGDAEVLLLPPSRSERFSLANFTGSPNLDEHFQAAVFISTDGTADQLLARLQQESAKKSPEAGALLAEQYVSILHNLSASFETRLVYDLLSGTRQGGLFYAGVSSLKLGNFDVLYDPTAADQILVGKLADREGRSYFDIWTTFPARSFRNGATVRSGDFTLDKYRIESTIEPNLQMKAVARAELTVKHSSGVIPLVLAQNLRVTAARVDGQPVEVFQRDSLRASLIAGGEDRQLLLVCAQPLDSATPHQIELRYEGGVIHDAGGNVYYVFSRGNWYPRAGADLARFDLTFRYPRNLTLAATGETVEDRTDGDWRITRNTTTVPTRFAGFNLGDFTSLQLMHSGYQIQVYANRTLETALQPKTPDPSLATAGSPHVFPRRSADPSSLNAVPLPPEPDPADRLHSLAQNVADTLDFLTAEFGPTPFRHLAITPIPGTFGQGFPGLVYLSTLAYLNSSQLPTSIRHQPSEAVFYADLLSSHEVAHQWWGNFVIPASSRDDWLMEALANYSALLLLEKRKGSRVVDDVLDEYRSRLLTKTASGRTLEEAGPITWGLRLESSLAPDAWRTVTYEKGTWIIHMLRRRLGDQNFFALLREVCSQYGFRGLSTEEFRQLAEKYMPSSQDPTLAAFFDNWVYGTGIPSVKLRYDWHASRLTGSLVQSDVDDAFAAFVPVEVQTANQRQVYWLATGSDPVPFSIPLKTPPEKVTLLTADCLIRVSK